MQHRLTAQFILDRLAQRETAGSFDAACLFVDISGFTPLTLALMEHGTEGAEVLANVLVAVFEPLIDAVYKQDGFIAGFAGDAFKAVFPIKTDSDRQAVFGRTLLAAWAIHTRLVADPSQSTRFGEFTFSGKVCAASGPVDWAIWQDASEGERSQRAASLFGGKGIAQSMAIDPHAGVGHVVITDALTIGLPGNTLSTTPVGEYVRVDQLDTVRLSALLPTLPIVFSSTNQPHAADFFPQWLLSSSLQGEFRQVVTMFVNFERPFDAAELADFQATFFRLLDQYDGFLGRVGQIGGQDNGNTLLLLWGAPTGSEHDVERALGFILDLQEASPVRLRAGVTTRMAYAGFVGSPLAEEYTCYGSYVNLAARQLIAAGWGEVWIDDESARQAARRFETVRRGAHRFKGFADPQPVFVLTGRQTTDAQAFYAGALVGRQAETDRLRAGVGPVFAGDFAGIVTIEGEAGLGKSRLVHEFEQATGSLTPTPRWFLCRTDDILRRPLNPFRYWLRNYFGQFADASEHANRAAFDAVLDDLRRAMPNTELAGVLDEELNRSRSFLAALVDLHWEGSLYAELEPQLRLENMLDALKTLIKAESLVQPAILLLEDAHWLDDESRQFLDQLTRNVDAFPFALVVTQRPGDGTATVATGDVPHTLIQLNGLDDEQTGLIATALLDGPPSAQLATLIASRANGNPFFVEQIALYLREHGMLAHGEDGWQLVESELDEDALLSTDFLPTDVRAVLTARLDQLPSSVKEVVQTASVLGREFDKRVLATMLQYSHELDDRMEQADQAKIWSAINEARILFRHALLRDAAYDMQLRSRLRRLHRDAAGAVRAIYAGEPAPHYAELVHHYHQGEVRDEERFYAERAGEYAADQFANEDALRYISRALALTPADDPASRTKLLLNRETVLDVLGDRERQTQDLDTLLTLLPSISSADQATIQLRRAEYQRNTGEFVAARETVDVALDIATQNNQADLQLQCHHLLGRILWQMGQYKQARSALTDALQIATTIGDAQKLTLCAYDMGVAYQQEGNSSAATEWLSRARRGFEACNDRMGLARCVAMLGIIDKENGEYTSAQTLHRQALDICESIGWRYGAGVCLRYLSDDFFDLGEYGSSEIYQHRALEIALHLDDQSGEAICRDTLGLIYLMRGEIDAAEASCGQALLLQQEIGDVRSIAYAANHLGMIEVERGNSDAATAYFSQALDLWSDDGQSGAQTDSLVGLAQTRYELGDIDAAMLNVERIAENLASPDISSIEFPFRAFATCVTLMRTCAGVGDFEDQRADVVLKLGYDELNRRAALIADADTRRRFVENGPFHRELLQLVGPV